MARLPLPVALACAIALILPALAHGNGTRIYTVAGGGTTTDGLGIPATDAALAGPTHVKSITGDGFFITDATCRPLHVVRAAGSDTGQLGVSVGGALVAGETCTGSAAVPPKVTSPGGSIGLQNYSLGHPCCIADHGASGWLAADTDYGRVVTQGTTTGIVRLAGSSLAADCGTASAPAVPTSGDPADASFCPITALDAKTSMGDFLFAEARNVNGNNDLYLATGTASLPTPGYTLSHLTGAYPIADAVFGFYGPTLATNNKVVALANGGDQVLAGTDQAGFEGDGLSAAFDSKLNHPKGITVSWFGALVIADSGNCRIRALSDQTAGAIIQTIAGTGCQGTPPADLGDGGLATDAYVGHPGGIAYTPYGILIADKDDNRIRLIDHTSIVSAPSAPLATATPAFAFTSLDPSPRFSCKLDGVDIGTCDSGAGSFTLAPGTPDGEHTLAVWDAGHGSESSDVWWVAPPDPTPATTTFTIDTTPPDAIALQQPAAGSNDSAPSPTFTWAATSDATTGVDHYELWIDKAKNRDVPTSACLGDGCSAQATAPLSEGDHIWQVRAIDGVGNTRSSEERNLGVGGAPVAAFTMSPNPALVGRTVTFDAAGSSDPSGISRYEWDLDGDGGFETDTGGSAATTRLYQAPASVTVTLRVTDGTGKQTTATQTLKITEPGGAASLLGISINSGAQYTNTPNVKLLVKPPASASSIVVSNDGGFLVPATFPVASSIDWKLDSSGPERLPKTVYARFMLGPIISETYTDDIILDEIPPVVQKAALAPAAGKAASAAKAKPYVVKLKAKDSNSGVAKVQVTANKRKPGKLLAYKTKVKLKSAAKPKFVRAQDRAGNFSGWKKLR
jgi:hypothetical protein